MPSPAGKSDTPRTPTKLGRKPQQGAPKLGKKAEQAASQTEETLRNPAEDAPENVEDTKGQAEGQAEEATDDAQGKVSQAGDDLKQAEPKPIDDTEEAADDTKGKADDAKDKAKKTADDTVEGAEQKTDADETGDDETIKAGDDAEEDVTDTAGKTAEKGQSAGQGALSGARGLAGRASNLAGKAMQDPSGAAQEAGGDAQQAGQDVQDTGEEAGEEAQDTAEQTAKGAEGTAKGAKDTADDVADEAEDSTGDAKATAQDTADDAKDTVEDTTGQEIPGAPDLSVLKGLEVNEEGIINDRDGNPIGRLVEGDAEDLAGYAIGDDGEILDDDGDLVGRCEVLPDQVKDAGVEKKMPPLSVLKGLSADKSGQILNEDGDFVGHLIEGDPSKIAGMEFDENGEIYDKDGNLLAKAELHPDAADLVEQDEGEEEEDEEGEGVATDVADQAQKTADGAKDTAEDAAEAPADIEDELPGVDALEGMEVNSAGDVVDDKGEVVGHLAEGSISGAKGLTVNENGEVVDADGNVLGKVELADGAAEKLKEAAAGALDVRILEGLKVNKKGKVLDAEGEEIGELKDGEVADCAGKTINDKGEVLDKDGNVLGKVDVVSGEAAFEAMKALKEQLGEKEQEEAGEEEQPEEIEVSPEINTLEGFKVNKKGQVLNEDGEPIGELLEGDASECASKTINEKGEVLDKDGKVIGKVRALPQMQAAPEAKEVEITPDLNTLDGLKVNKKGQVLDEGEVIGELVEGEASECAGKKINDKGEVLDKDGNVLGKVKTLPKMVEQEVGKAEGAADEAGEAAEEAQEAAEDVEEIAEEGEEEAESNLPPLSVLEGLSVNKSGKIIDSDGNIVGELIEGDAKKLSKSGITADAEGRFWDNKGHVIGRAQTVAPEEGEEESPFAGLEGLVVVKGGFVEDENGNRVGQVVEGDPKKLFGRAVDEDGDILDKKGSVVGHAERYEEPEEEPEPEAEAVDLSALQGMTVNKQGNVIGSEGVPIARVVEGNPKELAGRKIDDQGQIWNDSGKVIGRVELIPPEEREAKPEGPFAGLEGLRVVPDGKVADEDDNIVGQIVEGNPKRLVGMAVDEDGDILDKYGNVKGHAEPLEEEEEEPDLSVLDGLTLNKQGYLVDANGTPIGRLVEGNLGDLVGRKSNGEGQIHGDTGKVVGRCELIPENERVTRKEGPFAGLEGLRVVKDGFVEDGGGNRVGQITEGDPKKLIGNAVDEDGDIIDKYGNVKGHAEPWEEEDEPEVDLSALAGCTVNKAGNVVDSSGTILGRVAEGDPSTMVGKKVDGKGQIWDNAGNVIGRAELVQGVTSGPEGPFAGFEDNTVAKDGTVQTAAGDIIGRVIEGDITRLVGHKVDEDGDINDKNGNVIGKAERWEPEEKERRINAMAGMRVNKEGEVRDENGDLIGRLTAGHLGHCAGLEIDDNGYVIDNDGNKVGEVTLLENIQEEVEEEETEEEKQRREDAELADKMANICQQTLERVQAIMKQITEHIEKADRTPRDELDEEELVNNVKPLIMEGSRILEECNGALRGLDPDGRIAAQAKGRAETREATPEEYRLADLLKELTTSVVTTIDNAKKKIADMPRAKKKLNPLWALLTEPLFQIIAAVGLLLTGVLNLIGRLLNGLGLGGLVNGLLGGLGINKLLGGLGLGSVSELLGGGDKKEKKKGGGVSNLPSIGGLLGKK